MSREREPMIPPPQPSQETPSPPNEAVSYDKSEASQSRIWHLIFVGTVVVLVIITISLSIYRALNVAQNGFMYFMLGLSLVGLGLLEIIMIVFVRRGHLPAGKTWFLYLVGGAVILESVFTNVALFQ